MVYHWKFWTKQTVSTTTTKTYLFDKDHRPIIYNTTWTVCNVMPGSFKYVKDPDYAIIVRPFPPIPRVGI
jgi:hypothetical protein